MLFDALSFVLLLGCCFARNEYSPLSVVNPYHNLAHHLRQQQSPSALTQQIVDIANPSLIYQNGLNQESNDLCAHSLILLAEDLFSNHSYALKMLDSWGKPESGILEFNLKWLGWYYECISAQPKQFEPQYCDIFIGKPSPQVVFGLGATQGITIGSCFPDTCSPSNISSLFFPVIEKLDKNLAVETTCPKPVSKWDGKDVLGVVVVVLLFLLVVASSLYDYISTKKQETSDYLDNLTALNYSSGNYNSGTKHRILTSFSVVQNTKKLLVTEQKPSDIHCLHGMRFISMSWVILGHSFLFPASYSNNLMFMARYFVNHWEFQAIGNATYSVDSFFFLSGLLVAYLGLRSMNRSGGRMNVALMYLFRYLRLTPAYALLILVSVSIWPKMGDTPLFTLYAQNMQNTCGKYWYTNLLYFNNLYPSDLQGECFAWGWYLANDTQFYLLAPLFLYLLYKFPKIGLGVVSSVTLASITITGVFSSITEQQPQALGIGLLANAIANPSTASGSDPLLQATMDKYSVYISDLYAKPWTRIGAYLIGMITGYIVHGYSSKIKMSKVVALLGWIVAATTACLLLYGLYPQFSRGPLNVNAAAFYNAVSRPVWTMTLAWVVVACTSGYGGPVNAFLSWKAFIPLSRLTYCTYLVHPLVIWWLTSGETLIHYSIQLILAFFLGTLVLSLLLAYFFAMLIEFPVADLMKILQTQGVSTPSVERPPIDVNNGRAPLVNEVDA